MQISSLLSFAALTATSALAVPVEFLPESEIPTGLDSRGLVSRRPLCDKGRSTCDAAVRLPPPHPPHTNSAQVMWFEHKSYEGRVRYADMSLEEAKKPKKDAQCWTPVSDVSSVQFPAKLKKQDPAPDSWGCGFYKKNDCTGEFYWTKDSINYFDDWRYDHSVLSIKCWLQGTW
jgi:hypothetical protein